jgi:hypothetical protein
VLTRPTTRCRALTMPGSSADRRYGKLALVGRTRTCASRLAVKMTR